MEVAVVDDVHDKKLALVQVGATIAQAQETIATLGIRRDALIRELSEAGVSRREVARMANTTPGRVQQLLTGELFKVQLSEGTPVYADGSTGPAGLSLDWEGIARSESAAIKAAQAHWRSTYGKPFAGGAVTTEPAGTPL
jgi:hypothetical protein